ncbi:UDP-N-acetylmuramoyl-L-alanine--D-glutamate ligase [uncultured Desulfuromusa sp.]|uniref:UDP-N-acetylmuramoyl-L-alanine--D-glutamate ligase n=1 Tax=uncultured Desulfuromusa sp. TaxID=219183 RepID=UPI002AA8A676|nr:UDP-N-acetylmuramoyl-L-alanine--D-glutamate ligase [uncultured Desulfuromusa sp.]
MKIDYSDKKVVVIGAGRSGIALVHYFLERGATVALSDMRERKQIAGLEGLTELPIRLDLGGHNLELFAQADLIAVSPGVPLSCEPLRRASSCGIPLLGEIELAAREIGVPIIGVTGTNGKSTTTSLIGKIMADWGRHVFVGGNLGTPLIEACSSDIDGVVVELSSFQLETIDQFHPSIALLLNLSSDHLDRYPDLQNYYAAKLEIFRNMTAADFVVLNADDPEVCRLTPELKATKVWFSAKGRMVDGLVRLGDRLVWNWAGADIQLPLAELKLSGEHNIENAMAAMIPALLQGCPAELAWKAVCSFRGLQHRMQLVRHLNGVDWYNDSKGTNVGSVMKSLAGFSSAVTLIAGGKDKGGDYTLLRPQLEQKVDCLILIGEAAQKMATVLSGSCEIRIAADLKAAVQQAYIATKAGGTVLLSPACSSFDMFPNYQVRGEEFERLVKELPAQGVTP